MPQSNEYLEILNDLKSDAADVVKELIAEEVMPLLKERQRIEKIIGNKEIKELFELEAEVK